MSIFEYEAEDYIKNRTNYRTMNAAEKQLYEATYLYKLKKLTLVRHNKRILQSSLIAEFRDGRIEEYDCWLDIHGSRTLVWFANRLKYLMPEVICVFQYFSRVSKITFNFDIPTPGFGVVDITIDARAYINNHVFAPFGTEPDTNIRVNGFPLSYKVKISRWAEESLNKLVDTVRMEEYAAGSFGAFPGHYKVDNLLNYALEEIIEWLDPNWESFPHINSGAPVSPYTIKKKVYNGPRSWKFYFEPST